MIPATNRHNVTCDEAKDKPTEVSLKALIDGTYPTSHLGCCHANTRDSSDWWSEFMSPVNRDGERKNAFLPFKKMHLLHRILSVY